jgi:hypothetical protein
MAAPTDFLRLYQELGLTPGATIEQIRQAYRRRVSELHPDRAGTLSVRTEEATARLQNITQLYNAALQFHRQHGRSPGSSVPSPRTSVRARDVSASADRMRRPPLSRTYLYASAVLACAIGAYAWLGTSDPSEDSGEIPAAAVDDIGSAQPGMAGAEQDEGRDLPIVVPAQLEIGLSVEEVESIEDAPVMRSDVRWDYGPSWIAFEKGKVVDWYSSPLQPLRRATIRPAPQTHAHRQP